MKFVISKNELGNLIRKVQAVVPQNTPIPILTHVLIEAINDEITLTATDLTVSTRCVVDAKVYEAGAISIPSKRFFQLVRELTDPNIELSTTSGEMAVVTSGSSRFRLLSMGKEDFPMLPDMQHATKVTIQSEELKDMLQRTSFAVSKEESRHVLSGVLLTISKSVMTFVGTDGKRLAKIDTHVTLDPAFTGDYILPIKAVEEIIKLCSEGSEATIFLDQTKIAIECKNTFLVAKLISGEFPDFSPVISTQSSINVHLHREELISLLRQVELFTDESSRSVKFTFAAGELILTANSSQVGEGKVSMVVDYSGAPLDIAFNPIFFLDILKHSKDELVCLGLTDPYNPGIITDSTRSFFVVMPMRLNE